MYPNGQGYLTRPRHHFPSTPEGTGSQTAADASDLNRKMTAFYVTTRNENMKQSVASDFEKQTRRRFMFIASQPASSHRKGT